MLQSFTLFSLYLAALASCELVHLETARQHIAAFNLALRRSALHPDGDGACVQHNLIFGVSGARLHHGNYLSAISSRYMMPMYQPRVCVCVCLCFCVMSSNREAKLMKSLRLWSCYGGKSWTDFALFKNRTFSGLMN